MIPTSHINPPNTSAVARRLPEEFLAAPGLPVQRALLLAFRYWPSRTEPELRQLAQLLLLTLEPLLRKNPPSVPNSIRDTCERLVREWDAQIEQRESGATR
ncbi:MAG: hypothetical protein HY700_18210 [Gemmatimonadetes bacterium]|nr:hypothetical protein [Gemmatimonadota bacterium]